VKTKITIPGTDLDVFPLGYGVAGFGTHVKGPEARRLISAFCEGGGNLVDTAHCYAYWLEGGLGASERELGACLAALGLRDRVIVATKGGHPDGGAGYSKPERYISPQVIARDLDESLERLGLDSVDLYYLHRDDPRVPAAEVIEILNAEAGRSRVRYLGASNWSVSRIAEANAHAAAHGLQGFVVSQVQWSLAVPTWTIGPDPTIRYVTPTDANWHFLSSIPIMAYSATANGYFAGVGHESGSFASAENGVRYARAVHLSRKIGCTPTQVALAWLLHQEPTVIPLFSTGSVDHLAEALGATEVALSPEEVGWLLGKE